MRSTTRMAAAWAVLAFIAQPVFSAEHEAEEKISLFAGDLGNAFWTLLIFALVIVVLGKFAWKPLLTAMQNRERFIRESLESAKRDREGAEARLKELEIRMQKARDEASAIVEEGRRDAEGVKRRLEEEAHKSAEEILDRAKREIGIARDTALKDLYEQSAQLAMNMAGTVLKRQLSPEDHRQLVQDALSEMRKGGNVN